MTEGAGTYIPIEEKEAPAGTLTIAPALPLPLRRFSRMLLFALAPALTLVAIWLIWSAPRRSVAGFTKNPEAYQAYARGLFFWNKRTEDGFRRSIEYFNEAIAKDPHYALAWAGLADTYAVTIGSNLAFIHYLRRDYDQAATCARRVLETEPDYFQSLIALGPALQQQLKYQEAIALLEKVREQQKDKASVYYNALEALGHAYAVAGQRAAAERIIAELKACPEDKDDTTYRQALIRAGLGEIDKAFALLETNSDSWTLPPVGLTLDPRFDNLRADARYEALMKKRFGQLAFGIGR